MKQKRFIADVNGGFKTLLRYATGIVITILIFKLAGMFGSIGFFAVPIAAFILVSIVIFAEKAPPLDFIPAIFIGGGAMACFLSYIERSTYSNASIIILLYILIGLLYGNITVLLRFAYERGST